jgi:hypothetical protein
MRSPRIRFALLVLLGLAVPSLLQAQRPASPRFQVNVQTAGLQALADLAMNARGEFVVTWIDIPDGGAERSILARRFAADGTPVTGEILVARNPADFDPAKAVVMDNGSFVVVFPVFPALVARRYGPDGEFLGESVVARGLLHGQYAVAACPQGGFALVWQKEGAVLTTRLVGRDGEPDWPERRIGKGNSPAIAVGPDGEAVVTWSVELPIPNQEHLGDFYLFAQRLGADGRLQGGRIAVQDRLRGNLSRLQVAKDGQGEFLVLWKAAGVLREGGTRSSQVGVFVKRFGADGDPLTGPVKVAEERVDVPRLAMDQTGNFDVAWSQSGVFVQRFTPDGTPFRPALAVDSNGRLPLVAGDANGNFVLVWSGFSEEILGQRFRRQ